LSVASITPPYELELGSSTALMPLARVSDDDLISLSRGHDDRAFEELVARYRQDLLRVCRRMMGSAEDAEDVLQEVFAAAYVAILADGRPIDCAPWLHRIARNRCLNKLRRNHTVEPLALEGENGNGSYACEGGVSTADKAHLKAELEMVVQDMLRLSQGQRGALVRYALGGYSYDQIAQEMGLSVASIRSLLMRARTALAEAAAGREISCVDARRELEERHGARTHPSAPIRHHVKACESCALYNKGLRRSRRSLYAIFPFGSGTAASIGSASGTGAGLGSAAGAGIGALATKAVAGLAVLALAGAGAAVIEPAATSKRPKPPAAATPPPVLTAPTSVPKGSSWTPLSHRTAGASQPLVTRAPAHSHAVVKRPPPSSLVTTNPGSQPTSPPAAVSKRVITSVSQPLVTRRTRPVPGSGNSTVRTRPVPQTVQPGTTQTSGSTTGPGTATNSSTQNATTTP
jgi:RNA polymerase sigma factor (sigma-70 family)